MIKNTIRNWCQELLGFDRYLFIFALVTIYRARVLKNEKEFLFFSGMINDDGIILDIGANIGIMTVLLAKKLLSSTVYAFEPVPANISTLKNIVRFYKLSNVKIFETALGDKDGEAKMIMPVMGHSRMQGLSHVVDIGEEKEGVFPVPMQQLDTIPELQPLEKISAIKIDVENFEYYVLKGGENLLRKHRPIIFCELWKDERRELCFTFVKALGYKVKVFEKGRLVDFNGQEALNYFFLP